jgi:hypothetical protein
VSTLAPETQACYARALHALREAGTPVLVGGAYAFARYTGVARHTKDFDVFLRREDCERAFEALREAGFHTELTFPHWLGKAFAGEDFIDLIFGAGNGIALVDDEWFRHARPDQVFGVPVSLSPPEEMIWSKAFIMERERFDGADIAHLIRAQAHSFDWDRLVRRFGGRWRVLLSHLILFGFIYPGERDRIPCGVMEGLLGRAGAELREPPPGGRVCQGSLLSRGQYLVDIDGWGYIDARLEPLGNMTSDEVAHWTAAIDRDG